MNDEMNRFEVARRARAGVTNAVTKSKVEHETARDAERQRWNGPGRAHAATRLDPAATAAKTAMQNERKQVNTPPPAQMSIADMQAVTTTWTQQHPEFYDTGFNAHNLLAWCREQIDKHQAVFGVELLNAGFAFLRDNGYLEQRPGTTRKRGELVGAAAVRGYHYTPPEVVEQKAQERQEQQIANRQAEDAANKALSFEELKAKVRGERGVIDRETIRRMVG